MSATLADDVQTAPAWNCGCKVTIKFADMQILSGKSFRSFKSFKGDRVVLVEK